MISENHRGTDVEFSCIACRTHEYSPYLDRCRDYYLDSTEIVDYVMCRECNLVQQHPLPRDTSSLYNHYPVHSRKSRAYEALRAVLMRDSYYAIDKAAPRKLLDYGCGDGWFLSQCARAGYESAGFEPRVDFAERLCKDLGIPIYSDICHLTKSAHGQFDVVTMHYVAEHLTDLDAAFEAAHTILKSRGELYFSVPNLESAEARVFGRKWHGLDPPRHINFPNSHAVRIVASRQGFTLASEILLPFPPSLAASLSNVVGGRYRSWLFTLLMPLALLANAVWPGAARGYLLKKV